jgi:hypothetical protein
VAPGKLLSFSVLGIMDRVSRKPNCNIVYQKPKLLSLIVYEGSPLGKDPK